jgi:hypothetical protein
MAMLDLVDENRALRSSVTKQQTSLLTNACRPNRDPCEHCRERLCGDLRGLRKNVIEGKVHRIVDQVERIG